MQRSDTNGSAIASERFTTTNQSSDLGKGGWNGEDGESGTSARTHWHCAHTSMNSAQIQHTQKYLSGLSSDGLKQGSNTMPLRHRPDFKQALSTWQRLQQEAGAEPQVPTYSYKHQQWGGTQFIFYMVELARFMVDSLSFQSQDGDAPSIEWTGRLVTCSIWKDSSAKDFYEFNVCCYRLIVYSWRLCTVTDGVCKHNTSNDLFSRCKSVQ